MAELLQCPICEQYIDHELVEDGFAICPYCEKEVEINVGDYHGDAVLAALTCIAEGKDVKPIKPIEVNATVATPNKNEPLTIEELRTMNEQPVWCETLGCWGIIIIENVGQWAGIPFLLGHQGCQFEFDIESRGLVVYRTKPITGVEK